MSSPEQADGFIMLKPDGIEKNVQPELEFELGLRGVSIIGETAIKATEWLPLDLWPTIGTHTGWLYSREYVEGHTLPVLWLKGDPCIDTPAAALDTKRELRRRLCAPSERRLTLMHCPDSAEDFAREATVLSGYAVEDSLPTLRARQHQSLANWLGRHNDVGYPAGTTSMILMGSSTELWSEKAHDWDYIVFTDDEERKPTLTSQEATEEHLKLDVRVTSFGQWLGQYALQPAIGSEYLRWVTKAQPLRDDAGRFEAVQSLFKQSFEQGRAGWILDAYVLARGARHLWAEEAARSDEDVVDLLGTDFAIRVQQLASLAIHEPFPARKHLYNQAQVIGSSDDERVSGLASVTPRSLRELKPAEIEEYSRHIFKGLIDPVLEEQGVLPPNFKWWDAAPQHDGFMYLQEDFHQQIATLH